MGRTLTATTEPWDRRPRPRKRMTRAELRRDTPVDLADNRATENDLESFLATADADARYALGLPELARWSQFVDHHYHGEGLDQVIAELLRAQTTAREPRYVAALAEAADVARRCRDNDWHLHVLVD